MELQLIIVLLLIAAALGFWVRQGWKAWRRRGSCSSACGGCSPAPTVKLIASSELTIRLRNK